MTQSITLTNTQTQVLAYAIEQNSGIVTWFPDAIKGGARQRVIDGLSNRGLIRDQDAQWWVTPEGYAALGLESRLSETSQTDRKDMQTDIAQDKSQKPRRETSKQAIVLAMLQRPEGATVADICAATGWQSHTVRGTFAGAFKKKLGLEITSEKIKGSDRVYRLVAASTS